MRPAILDELIRRFDRVRVTTNPSAKDIRYTLDYIVHAYWVGIYGLNTGRRTLESYVLLVVKDMLKDETVLEQELMHQEGLHAGAQVVLRPPDTLDEGLFSMIFTKKPLALWRKKCRRYLIENGHLRR